MANTLRFKRGLVSTIPTAALGEPLFTTDTFDLYIGNGTGNTRFQKYIASGTTSQLLRGDGSLLTMPIVLTSPSNGQVLKYNGTSWVNDSDAGITGSGSAGQVAYFTGATTQSGSNNLFWDNTNSRLGIGTNAPTTTLDVSGQIRSVVGENITALNLQNAGNTSYYNFIISGTYTRKLFASQSVTGFIYANPQATVQGGFAQPSSVGFGTDAAGINTIIGTSRASAGGGVYYYSSINGANHSHRWYHNQSEQMRLWHTGNLALGNASTDNGLRFQVTGDGYFSGNLGLGVTPSAWSLASLSAMQIQNGGFYGYSVNEVGVTSNCYYNSGWKYINSSFATQYNTFNGSHRWYNAPSGTAGNAITFTQAMTLDASGNLAVGTTTTTNRLEVWGSGNTAARIVGQSAGNATLILSSGGVTAYSIKSGNGDSSLRIDQDGTDRLILASGGNLGLGTTSPSAPLMFGKSVYGNPDSENFYRIKFQDNGGVHNDVGIGQTVAGGLAFNVGAASSTQFFEGTNGERMRLWAGGNLAIGGSFASNSGELLQVNGTMRVSGASTFNNFITVTRNQDANVTTFNATAGVTPVSAFVINTDQPNLRAVLTSRNGYSLALGTNDTNRLTIDTTGAATFSNTVTFNGSTTFNSGAVIRSDNGTAAAPSISFDSDLNTGIYRIGADNIGVTTGGALRFNIDATGAATFSSSVSGTSIRSSAVGTFGFNTANNGEFQIYATALDGMIMAGRGSANDMIIVNKSGSDVFRIPTGTTTAYFVGNVGIAMTPSYKLDVTGEARVSNAIAIGTTPDTNKPFKILKNINGTVGINFENTSTGSLAFSAIQMGTDVTGGTKFTNLVYASSGVTASGVYNPDGTSLINNGSGGLNFLGNPIRMYTGGSNGTLRWDMTNDGFITQYTGTNPSTNATDGYRQYSADVTAGNAAPHFRTENGAIIKLYQETTGVGNAIFSQGGGNSVLDDSTFDGYTLRQIVKALRNQGILA